MKVSVWKNLTPQAVLSLACHLLEEIGGAALHKAERSEQWRDENPLGSPAVYTVAHGFTLGDQHSGLVVNTSENWASKKSGDELVATRIHIRSLGEKPLEVEYRLGQLGCTLPPGALTEKKVLELILKVAGEHPVPNKE